MKNTPYDPFEKAVFESLQLDNLPELSSDTNFLYRLNRNLANAGNQKIPFYRVWFNGVCNGLAAAAVGVLILVSLNILPPLLVNASITGTGLIREKIVQTSLEQRIFWQQMVIEAENFPYKSN